MRLPIPIIDGNTAYDQAELRAPTPRVLAEVQRSSLSRGGGYMAALNLLSSSVAEVSDSRSGESESDRPRLNQLLRTAPFRTIDYLAIQSVVLVSGDDMIEGIYKCPMCKQETEVRYDPDLDDEYSRDRIRNLPVQYLDAKVSQTIEYELADPFQITGRSSKESEEVVLLDAHSLTLRHPTLADCMAAVRMFGAGESIELQFGILLQAITHLDGVEVSQKWRGELGRKMFDHISVKDLRALSAETSRYGLDPRIDRDCNHCGNRWKASVDTSSFFASALESS